MNQTYEADDFARFSAKFENPLWAGKKNSSYFYLTPDNKRVVIDVMLKKLNPTSILDYGCGRYGNALDTLKSVLTDLRVQNYDPFVPAFKQEPDGTFDVVICFNVLNAVKFQFVPGIINDLYNLSNRYVAVNVIIFHDQTLEEDGRRHGWYLKHLLPYFDVRFESISDLVPSIQPERGSVTKIFWLLEKKDLVPQPGVEPG